MDEQNDMNCDELADVAAELALGVLTGRARAQALAHLDHCEACQEAVRQLTMTGEELLRLLPASEPPPGFETRVLERISPVPATSRRIDEMPRRGHRAGKHASPAQAGLGRTDRTRRMLAAATITVAIAGAGLGGWSLRSATSPSARSVPSAATLVSAGHQAVGEVYVYGGSPGLLFVSVDLGGGNGTVLCQVVGADGQVTTIGSFRLAGGYGAWGSASPDSSGPLAGARLVSTDGTVLATAAFRKS